MTSSIHPSITAEPLESAATDSTNSEDLRFDLTQGISPDAMASNANRLMDAVFAEVDRMLERGGSLPMELLVEEIEAPASQPVVMPLEAILPPKLAPRDLIPPLVNPSIELAETSQPEEQPQLETEAGLVESGIVKNQSNDLLWLAVLCSSLLVSVAVLSYLFRDRLTQIWVTVLGKKVDETAVVATAPTAEAPSGQDADFLKYIQRSLDRLANQATNSQETATLPSPTTISISPAAPPTVVERVYVPVYPSPQSAATSNIPANAPQPSGSSPVPSPARPSPNVATNSSPVAVPNIAAVTHTLIGVLALGERSAALFEIDGTPQRIEIGGQIGSSGWTLVSINNQEAVVRKNGEVRSIYVGQKF